jgi:hypothetical protein
MSQLVDSDCIDLTVGAPTPDRGHEAFFSDAAAAAADRGRNAAVDGFHWLFNGDGIERWETAGAGAFVVVDDRLESVPGDDLGLFWCTTPAPADFILQLQWLRWRQEDASGVFVRFPRPLACADGNPAFNAIYRGFEVQIDEVGLPGATAIHRTGAIFGQREQRLRPALIRPPAEWNDLEITVRGQHYAVRLNGQPSTDFENRDPQRGLPSTHQTPSFIGLQIYPGSRVAFRRIAIKPL